MTLLDEKEELTRALWFIPAKETKLEPGWPGYKNRKSIVGPFVNSVNKK